MLLVRGCRSLAELGYTHVGLDGGWNYVRKKAHFAWLVLMGILTGFGLV
jgi:hypothetical protein